MRKFLIRWWYTPNWEQLALMRTIIRWNGAQPSWTQEEYWKLIIGAYVDAWPEKRAIEREDADADETFEESQENDGD